MHSFGDPNLRKLWYLPKGMNIVHHLVKHRKTERSVHCLITFLQKQIIPLPPILISISTNTDDVDVKIDINVAMDRQACFMCL